MNPLRRVASTMLGHVSVYQVLEQPVFLVYEVNPMMPARNPRFSFEGEVARMLFTAISERKILRNFYGSNRIRVPAGNWIAVSRGNMAELLDYTGFVFYMGRAPIPETGLPAPNSEVQAEEDPVLQAHKYLYMLRAAGVINPCRLESEWKEAFTAESACIPEARGLLKHPIWPTGDVEGWLDESPRSLPNADPAYPHLRKLFSGVEMDAVSECALFSYLFAAFHSCSLNQPRPLLVVDSVEQQVGKSVTGEAIGTIVDETPTTLTLDNGTNDGEEIVASLARGSRCLVLPNLAQKRNWTSTLLACLCTDVGQSRRMKYAAKATTFYGTLGITSTVLGAATLHKDLIVRMWRVSLLNKPKPRLSIVPQQYAAEHRLELQAEIMHVHSQAKPYEGSVSTRFPEFESAGCAAYAAYKGLTHDEVASLMARGERARHFFRDDVMKSLFYTHQDVFHEDCNWQQGGQNHLADLTPYDGARGFGFILKEGKWQPEK